MVKGYFGFYDFVSFVLYLIIIGGVCFFLCFLDEFEVFFDFRIVYYFLFFFVR